MTTNVFPLTFQSHIVFCVIAVAFFIFQFTRTKAPYQLLTVFAVLGTLLLYVSDSKVVFYGTGIFELIMLIAIAVSSAMTRKKEKTDDTQKAEASEDENGNS